ncbi:probable RNA-dependent RNA polymerase 5 isoform X2 [Amborella trichopoda]|uniref:probable RNA-dependent RNA polymerase 5 isoform X2 n=1 Tax=Amborella trichopoda TaxID=13333 RepID=UPI0009BF77D8|nr:probable RNA-dependent RNA polymerase 5 isoform X2 [Amborella trichopoda]|eukprot:XP_020528669.1 probable RNA-dependent RNA polymerase 5 isoform X2 [Amborella trichopoda]
MDYGYPPVLLPHAVEAKLGQICRYQSVQPASMRAREMLASIGESSAMNLLNWISTQKIRDFSAFIIYMVKNMNRPPDVLSSTDDVCECAPNLEPSSLMNDFRCNTYGSNEFQFRKALGELEFRKAFLILNYIGKQRIDDVLSIEKIRTWKDLSMQCFEYEVWRTVGERYASQTDRRNLDWDSGKAENYQCHVDPVGNFSFKGPFLESTQTHLRRVLGDDKVLTVKFAEEMVDERRGEFNLSRSKNIFRRIAKDGILVGLRRYHFFVFKDGGKEEKRKNANTTGVKCYFVCMKSDAESDMHTPYILSNKTIQEARSMFMDVHTVPNLAKYMARFSLILSKTIKLEVDLGSVNIERINDKPCLDNHNEIVYDQNGQCLIHTDGTGFISEDLMSKFSKNIFKERYLKQKKTCLNGMELNAKSVLDEEIKYVSGDLHLLIQFRLFYDGCAVKGTVLVNKLLPPNTIQVRPSMVKVERDTDFSRLPSFNSFEMVGTSNRPRGAALSRYLITLLSHGGVPKSCFMFLIQAALDDVQNVRYSKKLALTAAVKYQEISDNLLVARMIFCGLPLEEPYLQHRLSILMKEERKGLKEGKVLLPNSYYLMGTADPTGKLKGNEVCIILDHGQISGKVLVYRHPGLHFGDIHVFTATYIEDLVEIVGNAKFAIFFSTQGPRSAADEIANGDFDGDMYWISTNPELLHYFKAGPPWERSSSEKPPPQRKPIEYSPDELETELFDLFLESRFHPSIAKCAAADSWLVYMDRLLTLGDECAEEKGCLHQKMLKLADLYYEAVDAPKSGKKVEVPKDLKPERYPHFMERTYQYTSTSILGQIYDLVASAQMDVPCEDIELLPCFLEEVEPSGMEKWKGLYAQYRDEMNKALSSTDQKKSNADEVIQNYKKILYGAQEYEERTRPREEIFREACEIYAISYFYAKEKSDIAKCGFAWKVAGCALCELHALKQKKNSITCLSSVLQELLK